MKHLLVVLMVVIALSSCNDKQIENKMEKFKAEKVSRTASFTVDADIETVFPLFGAFEERKWEKGWDPELIYPYKEIIEEGTTFTSKGNDEESVFLWRVSKYHPDQYLVQYLVSTENRYWTITVQCKLIGASQTFAEVTYSYIGLNKKGNQLNRVALDRMYRHDLKDWEKAINYYLKNGKAI